MGLLDLFKSHADDSSLQVAKSGGTVVDIATYGGMRVEVTSLDGQLLFLAKFMYPKGSTASLYQISESALPGNAKPTKAHIRGYHEESKKAVDMEGLVTPLGAPLWRVEHLTVNHVGNDRSFFRLDMNVPAYITRIGGQGDEEQVCRLLNISVGGARIAATQRYWEGDRLLLNVKLTRDGGNSAIFCKVLRVIEKMGAPNEYGCQFMELTPADQEKITQNIFELQRKMRGGIR